MPATSQNATTSKNATKPSTSKTGTAPVTKNEHTDSAVTSSGKPDQAAYHAEQDRIKKEIDDLQGQLTAVKEKIGLTSKGGPNAERRNALKAQLDEIRGQQGDNKSSRGKLLEQIKALQESNQNKIKELQASKAKLTYKTSAEIDAQIAKLERQIESGNMKIVDERRAINDITVLKRQKRTTDGFEADQEAIDNDKARIEELRKQLDDPETKAVSDKFDAIKAELDQLRKEDDESFANRNQLYDRRNELQAQVDALYATKKESSQKYREASDRYYAKLSEDKARRAERAKAQRAAAEEDKKREEAERLREEAEIPAYQAEIEDCQTLIDYLSGNPTASSGGLELGSTPLTGVPKLELRKVEEPTIENLKIKKEWFIANQAIQTAANKAKAEKEIAALTKGKGLTSAEDGNAEAGTSGVPTEASSPAPAAQEIEAS
ncbi:hypothetical protein FRC02_012020 [Tulasnella sp. 418]|nr:hypothetical protein FRC02_012020 [Tulasnella sp. 418]